MNKNKQYFKKTFEVIQAPQNLTKEVINMAKNLNQNNTDSDNLMVTTSVEVKSNRFSFKNVAVVISCIAIVGGSIFALNSIEQGNILVSTQPQNDSNIIGQSSTVEQDNNLWGMFNISSSSEINISYVYSEDNSVWQTCTSTTADLNLLNVLDSSDLSKIDEETFSYTLENGKNNLNGDNNNYMFIINFTDVNNQFINMYISSGVVSIDYYNSVDDFENKSPYNWEYYQFNDIEIFNQIFNTLAENLDNVTENPTLD